MASFFFFFPCFFVVILMCRARLHALAKFIKKGGKKGIKQATGGSDTLVNIILVQS